MPKERPISSVSHAHAGIAEISSTARRARGGCDAPLAAPSFHLGPGTLRVYG